MAKPKQGKVLRVSNSAWAFVNKRRDTDSIIATVDELIESYQSLIKTISEIKKAKSYFALPGVNTLFATAAEARGVAILKSVKEGYDPKVEPIELKAV